MNVRAVIVAAGYGTRFLPLTKTVPKEMIPVNNRPVIDYIIDELADSGIRDILIITSRRKKALEDYFDIEFELETTFIAKGDMARRNCIRPRPDVNIFFTRQERMRGTGHAVMSCRPFIGDSPFIVCYPDDLVIADPPLSKQLIAVHEATGGSVLAVKNLPGTDVSRYGVIDPEINNGHIRVNGLVEKPERGTEPSNMVSFGRYLFTPDIFDQLTARYHDDTGREFFVTDAIDDLAKKGTLFACDFQGTRYDTGDPLGYLKTVTEFALGENGPDPAGYREFLRQLLDKDA